MDIQDYPARQGVQWVKEAWRISKGARPAFLGIVLLFLLPLLAATALPKDPSLAGGLYLWGSALLDLALTLLSLGGLLFALEWKANAKKDWRQLLAPWRPEALKSLAPLLAILFALGLLSAWAELKEVIAARVVAALAGIFIGDAIPLRWIYGQDWACALKTSVTGRLLNFWALVVAEIVALAFIVLGLGIPALLMAPLAMVIFMSIYKKSAP